MTDLKSNQDQNPDTLNANTQDQHARVTLTPPMGNQNLVVSVTQGLDIITDFEFSDVTVEKAGDDIIFRFPQGGSITLENINALIDDHQSPTITMQDGSVVSADQIVASILSPENEVTPEAGEAGEKSGGAGEYQDNPGTILEGVEKLDGLGFELNQGIEPLDIQDIDDLPGDPSQGSGDGRPAAITINDVNLTNDNTPVITGTAEAGSTVIIEVGGVTMATTADTIGNWSVIVPDGTPLPDGSFVITGTATDAQGNMGSSTASLEVDTTVSADISLDGNITAEDVANAVDTNGHIAVTGTVGGDVGDGDIVTVTLNGNTYTGPVSGGTFSINVPGGDFAQDPDQSIDVSVTTTDAAGNTATAIDIGSYGDGGQISLPALEEGPTASISFDSDITVDDVINAAESGRDISITGKVGGDVGDGDAVTLSVNGNTYTGLVSDGQFSIDVAGGDLAADPDRTIEASVTTTDAGGNSTTATDTESYGVDIQTTAVINLDTDITPDNIINAAESQSDITISGKVGGDVVDGDTVTLTVSGNTYTGKVSGGTFSIDVPGGDLAADGDHTISASVTATDAAGNTHTATDTESYGVDTEINASITLDADITADDVINAAESHSHITITGKVGDDVSDGDTVTLMVNGYTYTGKVVEGEFSIAVLGSDLAADSDKTIDVSVTTTDKAGNSATATTTESYGVVLGFDTADDVAATRPNEPVEIDVLANDAGDGLQVVSVTVDGGDSVGTASIVDGKVVFQPSADLVGSPDTPDNVALTYTVKDAYGNVETAQAQIQTGKFHDEADHAFDSYLTDTTTGDVVDTPVNLTAGQGDASLSASLYPESSTTFDIEITVDKSVVEPNIDAYFLQDLTGSFRDDLRNIRTDTDSNGKTTLEEMVEVFEAKSGHSSYGTGTFVDTRDGDGGSAHKQFLHGIDVADAGDLNANAAELQAGYAGYNAYGGMDYPESQFYAIKQIAEAIIKVNGGNADLGIAASTDPAETHGFTAGSNPVVVLSTDAVSHGYLADDEDRFGSDPDLSGIMEMYAYVQASGLQLVVLAADHYYAGDRGAVTFWNNVLEGKVADVDSGWVYGGVEDRAWIFDAKDHFDTEIPIKGYVTELDTNSGNIVSALEKAVDNIEFTSPLSLVTNTPEAVDTDDHSYTNITPGDFVENPDGSYTQSWSVELEAPVGGSDDPQVSFEITDGRGNTIGESADVAVTVADGGHITGTDHFDTLIGSDTLSDTLHGGAGDDRMEGRDGNDILVGGGGDDLMIGGTGDDTFAFSANGGEGQDTIRDFNVDTDVIRLTDVLDADGNHDIDINDLLRDGGQNVSANVTGEDVELSISNGSETTVVTLEGINAGHNFDGDTTLSDLINHGLQIDPM